MRARLFGLTLALLALPVAAHAQSGTTQSRDGLGIGGHPGAPTGGAPAGNQNATTGPQSQPAYPSGSTTANPGAAFVDTQPSPATGTLARPPGNLSTTTVQDGRFVTRPGGPQDQERAGVAPPAR
ncbi:MAG: hypothetical protein H7Z10_07885 [Gemmatimonadaceae bacterium]|nr:hypothetical protein [Acetobacteraceae bacterium]